MSKPARGGKISGDFQQGVGAMKKWAAILSAAGVLFFLSSCKVSKPGTMENTVMKGIKQKLTIGGRNDKNPLAATPENIKEGGEHFQHHCQICHGLDGHATGVPF